MTPEQASVIEAAKAVLNSAFGRNARQDIWCMGVGSGKTFFAERLQDLERTLHHLAASEAEPRQVTPHLPTTACMMGECEICGTGSEK